MNFLSPEFALCFLAFFPLYWGLARFPAAQKFCFLLASYGLYSLWDWRFAALLLVFSCAVWSFSLLMPHFGRAGFRRLPLGIGVVLVLAYLGMLKYYDFFRDSMHALLGDWVAGQALPAIDFLLPIGVSFYSLNAVAYLVAVSRDERMPARFVDFLLFMVFFPAILAGPVLRPEGVLAQIEAVRPRVLLEPGFALWLICLGAFKKLVVASFLASQWVDQAFADPAAFHALDLWVAMFAYSIQIYCDFSGYTDVVTGLALLLGYRLPRNFNAPYLASNIKIFWQRWHISLSTFIRDFIYIPLGGSRRGLFLAQLNVLFAFACSGLWHGAETRYVVWGLLHGGALVVVNLLAGAGFPALPAWFGRALTFLFVSLAWVFFRADTLEAGQVFLYGLFSGAAPLRFNSVLAALGLAAFFLCSLRFARWEHGLLRFFRHPGWLLRASVLTSIMWLVLELGPSGVPGFIYFKY